MNSKQKLHQIKLAHWTKLFQEQASSGLTVKVWCQEHNISIHTYNYWKHLLKMECLDSLLPPEHDIVPLTVPVSAPSTTRCLPSTGHSLNARDCNSISITCGDIQVNIGSSVSEEQLLRILKAVRHA